MLSPVLPHDGFRVTRIQTNVVAKGERRLLSWLCQRLPAVLQPDHLTLIGVGGAVLVFVGYLASRYNPAFLWLATFGFIVHWFGDSLDGSLARYRRVERPVYGYFLDHTIDAICNLMMMVGLGCTLDVRMDTALFALIGYYLICIYVFINNHVSGIFRLSFLGFGPTELRLGLIAINAGMFFAGRIGVGGDAFTLYDVILLFTGMVFTLVFVALTLAGMRDLRTSTMGTPFADQSASMRKQPRG